MGGGIALTCGGCIGRGEAERVTYNVGSLLYPSGGLAECGTDGGRAERGASLDEICRAVTHGGEWRCRGKKKEKGCRALHDLGWRRMREGVGVS